MKKKITITESERKEIRKLYLSHDVLLEQELLTEKRGSSIGKKLARFLSSRGTEGLSNSALNLIKRGRNYYIIDYSMNGVGGMRRTPVSGDSFADYIDELIKAIEDGRLSLSDGQVKNLFTKLFLANDADFAVTLISNQIDNLDPTNSLYNDILDKIVDLVGNAAGNDVFKTQFPTEHTYFVKLATLFDSDEFINAGPVEQVKRLKEINTKPSILSASRAEALRDVQISYTRELIELIRGFGKSSKQIQSEIIDLTDAYASNDFRDGKAYARAILLKLNELETRGNDLGSSYLKIVKKSIEEKNKDGSFDALLKYIDTLDDGDAFRVLRDTAPQTVVKALKRAINDIREVFPLVWKSDTKTKIRFKFDEKFWKKLGTFILTSQFITIKDIYNTAIKSSGQSGGATALKTALNLATRNVAGQVLFPIINASFWGFIAPIMDAIRDKINNSDSGFWDYMKDWLGDGGEIGKSWTDFDRDLTEDWFVNLSRSYSNTFKKMIEKEGAFGLEWKDLVPFVGFRNITTLMEFLYNLNWTSTEPTNVTNPAEVEGYRDNINSFKNWLKDNDIEKKTTSIPKRFDNGAYEVTLKGDNTPTYYIYDNNTFKQD
jgi:hypothetical protein